MMNNHIQSTIVELSRQAEAAKTQFGGLSPDQLNWKPAADSWSIAQCFDHLIVTHRQYFPVLEAMAQSRYSPSFWTRISPFSGLFGRLLIKTTHPDNAKKAKTSPKAYPSESTIDADILEQYTKHQQELADRLNKLPANIDLKKTIIPSPLLEAITYSLDDCLTIFEVHGRRHFNQARRVMAALPGVTQQA